MRSMHLFRRIRDPKGSFCRPKEARAIITARISDIALVATKRLGHCTLVVHKIDTGDTKPIKKQLKGFSF